MFSCYAKVFNIWAVMPTNYNRGAHTALYQHKIIRIEYCMCTSSFKWIIFLFLLNWRVAFAKGLQVIIRTINKDSELICTLSALHKHIYVCIYIYIYSCIYIFLNFMISDSI